MANWKEDYNVFDVPYLYHLSSHETTMQLQRAFSVKDTTSVETAIRSNTKKYNDVISGQRSQFHPNQPSFEIQNAFIPRNAFIPSSQQYSRNYHLKKCFQKYKLKNLHKVHISNTTISIYLKHTTPDYSDMFSVCVYDLEFQYWPKVSLIVSIHNFKKGSEFFPHAYVWQLHDIHCEDIAPFVFTDAMADRFEFDFWQRMKYDCFLEIESKTFMFPSPLNLIIAHYAVEEPNLLESFNELVRIKKNS